MSSESSKRVERRDFGTRGWVTEAVRRIQRGEGVEANFELLFREYEPKIRRRLRQRGWRGADLEDLVQDAMIRVYRGLETFRLDASFDTWMLLIVSNVANNAGRDRNTGKARATRASLEGLLAAEGDRAPALAEPAGSEPGPLDNALSQERKARLAAALEQLPTRVRQCLLFRYQGYKYREIAQAQGVSIATVKKQIGQGHRRLRPILGRFVELFALLLLMPSLLR